MPASRRDDLIDAAVRVFSREGFRATCIDKVLEEGGLSRMTLYNHFRSKDELIVAALRRRDEIERNEMMKFAESRAADPVGRALAVFDHLERHLEDPAFRGCMFAAASAEYRDDDCAIRAAAADHRREVVRYLRRQCEDAGLADAPELAEQLVMLLDGATLSAQVRRAGGEAGGDGAARIARAAAAALLEAARAPAA